MLSVVFIKMLMFDFMALTGTSLYEVIQWLCILSVNTILRISASIVYISQYNRAISSLLQTYIQSVLTSKQHDIAVQKYQRECI